MKKNLIAFLISIILIGIGISISIFEFMDFQYINEVPINDYTKTIKKYEIVPESSAIKINLNNQSNVRIEENNNIDNIIIEITYYDEESGLIYNNTGNEYNISFANKSINGSKIINNIIEDLKQQKIYNYSKLGYREVIIYTNSQHRNLINLKNAR